MGFQIATTGVVVFIFCLLVGMLANAEPKQPGLVKLFGTGLLIGLFLIPIGLIIQIWQ